jgi:cystathionine gamma-lyase
VAGVWNDGTRCIRAGRSPDVEAGTPLLPGPVFAAPYHMDTGDPHRADFYGRESNPTWRALESAIGELDGGYCVLFPSGMARSPRCCASCCGPVTRSLPSDGYYQVRRFARGPLAEVGVTVR